MIRRNQHHPQLHIGNESDTIWRYFDLPKFLALLQRKALYFSRADLLGDPFEGSYTRRLLEYKNRLRKNLPEGRTPEQLERDLAIWAKDDQNVRGCTYVNCWHVGAHESMAMWQGYGGGQYGLAIQTTIKSFSKLVPLTTKAINEDVDIEIGRVRYVDYDSMTESVHSGDAEWGPPVENFLCKALAYRHEEEFRAIFINIEALRVRPRIDFPKGYWIDADLQALVQMVRVSPLAPGWFCELIEKTCQTYGFEFIVQRSVMLNPPIF